jgi:beta-lactamase superfamily II metal-dependent hydrolase
MTRLITSKTLRLLALAAAFLATACGGDGPAGPDQPQSPVITITGVTEGSTYPGPVSIGITLDRGSYQATLDGAEFVSGRTVAVPGSHVLVVTARNGAATSTKQVSFTTAGAEGGALIIRLLNLGANASGGGGDAILITDSTAAGMVHALVDAGPAGTNASNPGYVAQQLALLGVQSLEFVQLTHAHGDHFEGLPAVFSAFRAKRFIYNGQVRNYSLYNNLVTQARSRSDSVIVPAGSTVYPVRLGAAATAAQATVIPPLPTWIGAHTDSSSWINEGSLGTELSLGTFRMFLTGDGEVAANQRWRTQFATYSGNVAVLKAGHHGANDAVFDNGSSGSSAWLDHASPEVVVISANGTSHPRVRALSALRTGRAAYCTNVHGRIEIRVLRSGSYAVTVEKNAGQDCVPGSEATS